MEPFKVQQKENVRDDNQLRPSLTIKARRCLIRDTFPVCQGALKLALPAQSPTSLAGRNGIKQVGLGQGPESLPDNYCWNLLQTEQG